MRVSVIIPALNEEETIADVVRGVAPATEPTRSDALSRSKKAGHID